MCIFVYGPVNPNPSRNLVGLEITNQDDISEHLYDRQPSIGHPKRLRRPEID